MTEPSRRSSHTGSIIAAVVVLITVLVAFISILSIDGFHESETPLIITVLGFISTTVVSLLALARIEDTRRDLKNGAVEKPVTRAINNAFNGDDSVIDTKIRQALAETLLEHVEPNSIPASPSPWNGTDRRRE